MVQKCKQLKNRPISWRPLCWLPLVWYAAFLLQFGVCAASRTLVAQPTPPSGSQMSDPTSSGNAKQSYDWPKIGTVVVSVLFRYFVLRLVEMLRPDWYVSKERLVYNQYVKRVYWELVVYSVAVAAAFAAFTLYIVSGNIQTGIIFVVAIAEFLLKLVASACYAVHIMRAAKAYQLFRDVWTPQPGAASPDGERLTEPEFALQHRSKLHVQLDDMMLPVHDTDDVLLQYQDWNRMMPCIAETHPVKQAWQCVLAAYGIFQSGATKSLSHAWGHNIVIPRILAYDIYCQATWVWRDCRLRYYEPGHVNGQVDRVPGRTTRVPGPTSGHQNTRWLVEDTDLCQLTVLEHTALYMLAWDMYTAFVLSYMPLQTWRNIFDNPAVDSTMAEMHEQLRTRDAFGMDACAYAALTGALAFAKCIRDTARQGLPHHVPWHMPDKRSAVKLTAIAMMFELHSQMHNIDATAHISTCSGMIAAAKEWSPQSNIPDAADKAWQALEPAAHGSNVSGCQQCFRTLQAIENCIWLQASQVPCAVFA